MKLRSFCAIQAIISLAAGLIVYLLFRSDTILHKSAAFQYAPFADCRFFGDRLIRYYLPDAAWSYSFCAGLCAVHLPKGIGIIVCVSGSVLFGVLWETAQMTPQVPGTADILDIAAYLLGAVLFGLIFRRRRGINK